MKTLSGLKIGYKLLLFILIVSVVCVLGMIKINRKATGIENQAKSLIDISLKNFSYLNKAEKHINKAHAEIVQGIGLISQRNQSMVSSKISVIESNLDLAKSQFDLFRENLTADEKYQYNNSNSITLNFKRYYDIARTMASYLTASDSLELVRQYYLNNYLTAFKTIESSLSKFNDETLYLINAKIKQISEKERQEKSLIEKLKNSSFLFFLLIILLLIAIGIILERGISWPIKQIVKFIKRLSFGELPDNLDVDSKDEIGEITEVINQFVSGLKKTASFAKQIGEGNLDVDYKPLSDKDILGNALLEMRKGLSEAKKEEQKRKVEDDKRNWTTQGLAKFGEILRKDNDNLNKLANDIVSNLISYINANQGGLFLYNDEEEDNIHLELIASYAYSRKKFQKKKIQIGEGLVGTCVVEKETIYLTEVPDDYIEISSGLGDANPRSILIVPLKLEDKVFGVIELASFNPFEQYQIEFVEKIGESIASTLSSVKINAQTAALLEETKLQAEEMATKEEEMRQNLEELKATQEEMERIKQREGMKNEDILKSMEEQRKMLVKILDQIPEKVALKDKEGKIVLVNSAYAKLRKTSSEELIGQSDYNFYGKEKAQEIFTEEVEIMNTGPKTFEQVEEVNGEKRILKTTKMPFYIPYLKQTGLLGVQTDITDLSELHEKEQELLKEIEKLKKELNK